jgi:hypothetical protein
MGEKALWPTVAVITILGVCITVMLTAGVDVLSVVMVFSIMGNVAGSVISMMLYGKIQKVESNTNGAMASKDALISDLVEAIKASPPVDSLNGKG